MIDLARTECLLAERLVLETGWEAGSAEPGDADHRLDGVRMTPLVERPTGSVAGEQSAGWNPDERDWWFRCSFEAPDLHVDSAVSLCCEGIATLGDVWLNGVHVLETDDMHLSYETPVTELLQESNELVIGVRALEPVLAQRRPRPRWRTRLVRENALRWVRTSLCGRIPAFAPGPPPVGPWRPVSLVHRRGLTCDGIVVRSSTDGTTGTVRVKALMRQVLPLSLDWVRVQLAGPTGAVESDLELEVANGEIAASGAVSLPSVELWWPHTHGAQPLYEISIIARSGEVTFEIDRRRIGFRHLAAIDEPGLALAVNSVDVFWRGAALLPGAHSVDHAPDVLRDMLARVRNAGMNMVRLSGVGTYGSDLLYDLCDELGIVVWQDFPFANLDYPIGDESFCALVEIEAASFLARVGSHPSLAVLCGNSEVEQQVGMLGLDAQLGAGPLFEDLLPRLVRAHDIDAHYVRSSPTGGDQSFRPNAGVAHYFGVGAYLRPIEDARRADVRFASECLALANVPDDEVLDGLDPDGGGRFVHHPAWKTGVPRDRGAGWDFDDVRDHYFRLFFNLEPVDVRRVDPERYIELSRIVTGEVMAATLGEWRRAQSTCGGALVWTLNDVLPGCGWGILDYRGRPKPVYWFVRRALHPIAVWMTDEGLGGLYVHVANDTPEPRQLSLQLSLSRADGLAVADTTESLAIDCHSTIELSFEGILGRFADAARAFRFGPGDHDICVATLRSSAGALLAQAHHFPGGPPLARRSAADLGLEAFQRLEGERTTVSVRSSLTAYGVTVELAGSEPDDNHFVIAPGGEHQVSFPTTVDERVATVSAANLAGAVRAQVIPR